MHICNFLNGNEDAFYCQSFFVLKDAKVLREVLQDEEKSAFALLKRGSTFSEKNVKNL